MFKQVSSGWPKAIRSIRVLRKILTKVTYTYRSISLGYNSFAVLVLPLKTTSENDLSLHDNDDADDDEVLVRKRAKDGEEVDRSRDDDDSKQVHAGNLRLKGGNNYKIASKVLNWVFIRLDFGPPSSYGR